MGSPSDCLLGNILPPSFLSWLSARLHRVQLLDRDLEEAEEQHQLALRSHLLVLDSLLDLQASRLAGLEAQFNQSLKELQDEFAS